MCTSPPLSSGRQVLVFVRDGRDGAARSAIATVQGMHWPNGLKPQVEDLSASQELARWYGVVKFPAVAIVDDGMLVAIEHECSAEACERLLTVARARASALNSYVL